MAPAINVLSAIKQEETRWLRTETRRIETHRQAVKQASQPPTHPHIDRQEHTHTHTHTHRGTQGREAERHREADRKAERQKGREAERQPAGPQQQPTGRDCRAASRARGGGIVAVHFVCRKQNIWSH